MQTSIMLTILLNLCMDGFHPPVTMDAADFPSQNNTLFEHVGDIPLPEGFHRVNVKPKSFGEWLRKIRLKTDNTVYLFDGSKKANQDAQFAVLDKPVGNRDLQQCADALMRLRAEFLLSAGRRNEICFTDNAGKRYLFPAVSQSSAAESSTAFEKYLEKVYTYCGTSSLSRQLKPVAEFKQISAGDVLIKGGFPGHAVLVMDIAENEAGQKIYMIAQSYMPAQSIHILRNPRLTEISPWYRADRNTSVIKTPEWTFQSDELMHW